MFSDPKENTNRQLYQIRKMIHKKMIISTEIENSKKKKTTNSGAEKI